MDRNLGASRVCQSNVDTACYGDYYQWGRPADGHQKPNSATTSTISISTYPDHGDFITYQSSNTSADWTTDDDDGAERQQSWNPCPNNFYVPNIADIRAENIQNSNDAFVKLKLPLAGSREVNGTFDYQEEAGGLWTSIPFFNYSVLLATQNSAQQISYFMRLTGASVRCIQKPKTITSSVTGRVWMDRNLGAQRACQSYDDEQCYGDYYQWGRRSDGHQKASSSTTPVVGSSIFPDHGNFVTPDSSPFDWSSADSNGSQRQADWNPCPTDFRIPTITEFQDENLQSNSDAFTQLKLPSAGFRSDFNGVVSNGDTHVYLWSSGPNNTSARMRVYSSSLKNSVNMVRARGASIRCIKE